MTSKKLRKYLAYYQKTLRDEPDNIEARLRLAAIFRDMGRKAHAVEEYVTASKLLAREGLPLEAIAACKAVLELEPQHTETQLFLARLFARVPDAAGGSARIARPVEPEQGAVRRTGPQEAISSLSSHSSAAGDEPITLSQPKPSPSKPSQAQPSQPNSNPPTSSPAASQQKTRNASARSVHEQETAVGSSSDLVEYSDSRSDASDEEPTAVLRGPEDSGVDEAVLEQTRQADAGELPDLDELRVPEEREKTQQLGTVSRHREDAPPKTQQQETQQPQDDHRSTVEMDASDRESVLRAMVGGGERGDETDIRTTMDVDQDDIVGEEFIDAPQVAFDNLGADTQEFVVDDDTSPDDGWQETFEVGVFDMESLRLDRESTGDWDDLSFLDELDEPDTAEVAAAMTTGQEPSMLSVSRADLPQIPLFSRLEPSVFMQLLQVMELNEVAAGTSIVVPGRTERSLFVIVRGTAKVSRTLDDQTTVELARLGEGEFFGEFALLTGRSQMATVSAQTPMALLEVRQEVLDLMAEDHPEIWEVLWDFYHARMLNNMLASSTIFRSLSDEQRHGLAQKFTLEEVGAGELLLGEGDQDFDLYLICSGEVRVEREVGAGGPQEIDVLREGEFVGLISSAEEEPVVANLRATCATTLLVLSGSEFRRILEQNPRIDREVRRTVRERKAVAGRYTSGVTSYAELGLAPHADSTD